MGKPYASSVDSLWVLISDSLEMLSLVDFDD